LRGVSGNTELSMFEVNPAALFLLLLLHTITNCNYYLILIIYEHRENICSSYAPFPASSAQVQRETLITQLVQQ